MPEPSLRHWLEHSWYGRAPRLWLLPLSWLYGGVVHLRRLAYRCGVLRSRHPGIPVIVVGNLTVGGTGKTPLVIWLAGQLQRESVAVGVVLRGHGGRLRGPHLVAAQDTATDVGDEAALIAGRTGCPVAIGVDRAAAAALLVEQGCRIVIADDGLQHLGLARDFQVVVVDAERRFGNGALLPAGPLREPVSRLREADCVVVRGGGAEVLATGGVPVLSMQVEAAALRPLVAGALPLPPGSPVHAVAGIGHPPRFFAALRAAGLRPFEHAFADHHRFEPRDLAFDDALPIVMTEKDAVKCRAFASPRMWVQPVEARLPDADARWLLQKVASTQLPAR